MMQNMNNMSAANIRQTVKLQGAVSAGAASRAQSAVNTAQSSNYNPQMMNFMNGMPNGPSASVALPSAQEGGSANVSQHGRYAAMPRSINAEAAPLVGNFRDAPKSADGKFRNAYMSQHMSHPAMMQQNGYMTQGGVMQGPDGNMIGMQLGGTASAGGLQSEGSNEYLAPHALMTHQAASKKSFRIRGQVERDRLQLSTS